MGCRVAELIVSGGRRLSGSLSVPGAKNSILPIMAACFLTDGECILHNSPVLSDVAVSAWITERLGGRVLREGSTLRVNASGAQGTHIPPGAMGKMRSSILFLGVLLAKLGNASLCAPGGCNLGPRPIDLHLQALTQMGACFSYEGNRLSASSPGGLHGAELHLPFPSVGATENILLAACTARGETLLTGAAQEPEIADLAHFLNACGARIRINGDRISVVPVKRLHGAEYTVMPDRIAGATYLCAAAATGGTVRLRNTEIEPLRPVLNVLERGGCTVLTRGREVLLRAPERLNGGGTVITAPYPGFPTDVQALTMAAFAGGRGNTVFSETVFPERFRHVPEMVRMGARIRVNGTRAEVCGARLHGADVRATDLRGGAALVVAALAAEDWVRICEFSHIERGYEDLPRDLAALGAELEWEEKTENPA